jgi:hypothetical protein
MPTRAEIEATLGKRWAEMAYKEGHRKALPKKVISSGQMIDSQAETLIRVMDRFPRLSVRGLAARMSTSIDDVMCRMMHLQREGRVRLVNETYEVVK